MNNKTKIVKSQTLLKNEVLLLVIYIKINPTAVVRRNREKEKWCNYKLLFIKLLNNFIVKDICLRKA